MLRKFFSPATSVLALWLIGLQSVARAACGEITGGVDAGLECGNKGGPTVVKSISIVTNTLLFAVGVIAVIMLIIGGIKYITSSGDPKGTQSAKDTIMFAVVGVVVALLAYAIVNFVLGQFK